MLNSNNERALVYLANVDAIEPITFLNAEGELEEASSIEKLVTGGWNMVVQKNRFEVDQLFVYAECDTVLPKDIPLFSFLEGKRIKTKKLKGVISQGVCFTIPEILEVIYTRKTGVTEGFALPDNPGFQEYHTFAASEFNLGDDWTELVGAVKYEEYTHMKGDNNGARTLPTEAKGKFPSFIHKTDEERVQNLTKELKYDYAGKLVVAREKLHGSSITIYCKTTKAVVEGLPNILDYGVCSRNLDLKLDGTSSFITTAIPALKKLVAYCNESGESLALQGELIGPAINGNPYNLPVPVIRFFTCQDISDKPTKFTDKELCELLSELDEDNCPLIDVFELTNDLGMLLEKAEGKSVVNTKYEREGKVIRAVDGSFSFKVINNKWLLKEKD